MDTSKPPEIQPVENPFLNLNAELLEKLNQIAQKIGKTPLQFVEDWIIGLPNPKRKNVEKALESLTETAADFPSMSGVLQIHCPNCAKAIKVTKLFIGKSVPCPQCRASIQIPAQP